MANLAIFTTLPQHQDHIFYDEYVHASMIDGMTASKANRTAFRHNDMIDLSSKLKSFRDQHTKGNIWIAVESVYSMDGDLAPLTALLQLAKQHQAFCVIDEAHATGVFGINGEGLIPPDANMSAIIRVHPCGKALGATGALVGLNAVFYDYLINRARTFIYTTAPSPLIAAAVHSAIDICKHDTTLRNNLHSLMQYANQQIAERLTLSVTHTQIIPVILKCNTRTQHIAQALNAAGYHVKAIRPPTVSEGTARLRLSISLHVTKQDIDGLLETLIPLLRI